MRAPASPSASASRAQPLEALLQSASAFPSRIVCVTEEPTETLYRIGAGDLVIGVSGYTVRPPEARSKPKVSSFLDANFDRILELRPDLVIGFSDLQADLARELIQRGVPVVIFNQRSIAEILQTIRATGALVGRAEAACALAEQLAEGLENIATEAASLEHRPRVFFEEWPDPLIANIRWTGELIETAGGIDVAADVRARQDAAGRTLDPAVVVERNPDVIIASWCGKKVRPDTIRERPGWDAIAAVQHDQLYEIKSAHILQPGPAALDEGARQLADIIGAVSRGEQRPAPRPGAMRRAQGLPR